MADTNPGYYFNSFYVDYIKSIFLTHPTTVYSELDIIRGLPKFCDNNELLSVAINILMMNGIVIEVGKDEFNHHKYKISPEYILKDAEEKQKEQLNKKIDLELKRRTIANFYTPYIISALTILLAIISLIVNAPKDSSKDKPPIHILLQSKQKTLDSIALLPNDTGYSLVK